VRNLVSLSLRKEHRLRLFGNMMLRKIYRGLSARKIYRGLSARKTYRGPQCEELTVEWNI
jgi:hypothetical protein